MEALPAEGPERRIFLTALRQFSDSCSAPQLQPSCPFFRRSGATAWCDEECVRLLEHYDVDPPGVSLSEADEIVAIPGRAETRRTVGNLRPFDARAVYLTDIGQPIHVWRPSTLILRLDELVLHPPQELLSERLKTVRNILTALEEWGFDIERHILGPLSLMASTLVITFCQSERKLRDLGSAGTEIVAGVSGWRSFLNEKLEEPNPTSHIRDVPPAALYVPAPIIGAMRYWFLKVPLADLLAFRAPSAEEFAELDPAEAPQIDEETIWLRDRFTETQIEDWAPPSLDLEWGYANGQATLPCSLAAMRTRVEPRERIALAITRQRFRSTGRPGGGLSIDSFVRPALGYLRTGRRDLAAGIFETCIKIESRNPQAHNNFGFCLLPDDPTAALAALDVAAELGMEAVAHNVANRMLALRRLGRGDAALNLAQRYLDDGAQVSAAYLWDLDQAEPVVVFVDDVRRYVARLAEEVANEIGDASTARTWRALGSSFGADS